MRFRYNKNILISTTLAYLTDLAALWRESVRVPDLQPDVLRPSASPRLLPVEESAPFSAMAKKYWIGSSFSQLSLLATHLGWCRYVLSTLLYSQMYLPVRNRTTKAENSSYEVKL